MLTTGLDETGRRWDGSLAATGASRLARRWWTALDNRDLATDQKAGGSSPSERASEATGQGLATGMGDALSRCSGPDLSQFLTALKDLVDSGERSLAPLQVLIACVDVGLLGECRVVVPRPLADDQGGALRAPRAGTSARPPALGRPRPARAGPRARRCRKIRSGGSGGQPGAIARPRLPIVQLAGGASRALPPVASLRDRHAPPLDSPPTRLVPAPIRGRGKAPSTKP
jgi:hypothetical protein